ncbi:AMP-binding protein [Aestuariivivens sediminis]|uniref:AMP-binding protein n=1 Tax=Aestuariivivens sediminis TaxID=2913557 RepID=UPI001F56F52B|nr:AMP-binding protein [Aestuariivivens sediminis]
MTPDFTKVHNRFKLNNHHYNFNDLMEVAYSFVKEGEPFERALGNFLLDWLDNKDYLNVQTSGSTGTPKKLKIKKQHMVNSAIMTGDFFKLEPGDNLLSCLPSNFIAGKMMIIRAVILGLELELIRPSAFPLIDYQRKYDFCAMTPMQLKNFLKYSDNLKTIIVGGSKVPKSLIKDLQEVKANVYETFGMTETITHIAVKKLNNFKEEDVSTSYFKVLPDIKINQDKRGCLIIDAPKLSDDTIVTNDVVTLHGQNEFEWLGRYDNVINSGGIKLHPEAIESKLRKKIQEQFFIASEEDDTLGSRLILVIESDTNTLGTSIFDDLGKYEVPKKIYTLKKFIETKSGKIHRKKTLALLNTKSN